MGHLVKCGPAGVRRAGVTTGKMREKSAGVTVQTELCWQEFWKIGIAYCIKTAKHREVI